MWYRWMCSQEIRRLHHNSHCLWPLRFLISTEFQSGLVGYIWSTWPAVLDSYLLFRGFFRSACIDVCQLASALPLTARRQSVATCHLLCLSCRPCRLLWRSWAASHLLDDDWIALAAVFLQMLMLFFDSLSLSRSFSNLALHRTGAVPTASGP